MSDRELLELAAKAAGMEMRGARHGVVRARVPGSGPFFPIWNPLADDGDALRLAVKLRIHVEWPFSRGAECVQASLKGHGHCGEFMWLTDDPASTARRAIVRAAAEIGKAKQ